MFDSSRQEANCLIYWVVWGYARVSAMVGFEFPGWLTICCNLMVACSIFTQKVGLHYKIQSIKILHDLISLRWKAYFQMVRLSKHKISMRLFEVTSVGTGKHHSIVSAQNIQLRKNPYFPPMEHVICICALNVKIDWNAVGLCPLYDPLNVPPSCATMKVILWLWNLSRTLHRK